jgi:hypothetical protein
MGLPDVTAATDPLVQRETFETFVTARPGIAAATEALLAAHPRDARAMAARGWVLAATGWAMRGTETIDAVPPEGPARMNALHAEALDLAQAAIAADPGLLPASDLLLALAPTTGRRDLVVPEFERVMAIYPSRHSQRLAAVADAPQWGGSGAWADRACETWADRIKDRADDTVRICKLDMIFAGGGRAAPEDRHAVAGTTHPILARARNSVADSGLIADDQKWALLEAAAEDGSNSLMNARALDEHNGTALGEDGRVTRATAVRLVADSREALDRSPADRIALAYLMMALPVDTRANGAPWPQDEIDRRFADVFALVPYDSSPSLRYRALKQSFTDLGTAGLEEIEANRAYLIHGVVASNHTVIGLWYLDGYNRGVWQVLEKRHLDAIDATGAPAFDKAAFDAAVVCPTVRAIRLMEAACAVNPAGAGCPSPDVDLNPSPWPELLECAKKRGACETELTAPLKALRYAPVPVDRPGQ